MFGKRMCIFAFGGVIFLLILAIYSFFFSASLRWTHWALSISRAADASPGTSVASTLEVGLISGRIRWMQTDWLTTPHVPASWPKYLPAINGLSLSLRDRLALPLDQSDLDWHLAGFGYGQIMVFREGGEINSGLDGLWQANATELCVPIWFLILLAIVPLLGYFWRWRKIRGIGCCRNCGYDLRATPERCPECGTPVEHKEPLHE